MKIIGLAAAAAALAVFGGATMAAGDDAAVMATINGFNDALNSQKPTGPYLAASQTAIDEFAPYHWSGSTGVQDWATAFGGFMQKGGITEPLLKLGQPSRIEHDGAHAYAIVPAEFTFKQKGQTMHEHGSFAFALDEAPDGWKIASFSWSGPRPAP
jgi:hypothetical protein